MKSLIELYKIGRGPSSSHTMGPQRAAKEFAASAQATVKKVSDVEPDDMILDIGPEGGDKGGTVIAKGTPEEVAAVEASYTVSWMV